MCDMTIILGADNYPLTCDINGIHDGPHWDSTEDLTWTEGHPGA